MFWLNRPPYLQWAAAALIVVAAFVWDLRGRGGVPHPFAGRTISAGEPIETGAVEFRTVPRGLMKPVDLAESYAGRDIPAGEPITGSALRSESGIPEGWWSVPVALPAAAAPGTHVRLVVTDPPLEVDGVVVASSATELLGTADAGLVAVPSEATRAIALAAVAGSLLVLLRP